MVLYTVAQNAKRNGVNDREPPNNQILTKVDDALP